MGYDNVMKIEFLSKSTNEGFARVAVESFVSQLDPTIEELSGIKDKGQGIENIDKAKEPLYTTKPDLERSGMGFTIMENFMDNLVVKSVVGKGTTITMTKKIKKNIHNIVHKEKMLAN